MKICPDCQQENPRQANFCNNCGLSLKDAKGSNKTTFTEEKQKAKRLAERRQLTILFCDLVGSTSLSERMDPEDYRQMILDYQNVAEGVIARFNGHVGNYLGDGLLVYFGYPEGLEDAPKAAVRAGLGILNAIAGANQKWESEGKNSINIRIGIHTGLVVVDDHLALGETVNIAARLEGLAPTDGLVVSLQTYNLIKGWFDIKSIGKHILKGITDPMEVFQVSNEREIKSKIDVARGRGLSPLVGRTNELYILTEAWENAKKGSGNLVLLNGEAGIGKSRLVDTLEQSVIKEDNIRFLEARCSSYQRNSAFYPIIKMFEKDLLHFNSEDNVEQKIDKLKNYVLDSNLNHTASMQLLAEFLSISTEEFRPIVMSPFAKRQKTLEVLKDLIFDQAKTQSLLIVMEDLHWADASSLELLNILLNEVLGKPVFLFCTARPGFQPQWKEDEYVKHVNLDRLSVENMIEICHHQSKGKTLPKEILDQITSKTDGVPLFVEELTKMILEGDYLVEKGESYEVLESEKIISIPSTLQDSLLARLDKLSDVKEIVQMGAVLGREFSFEMMNAVFPLKEGNLKPSLNKLLNAEIFREETIERHSVYQFKHALIRDTAYDSMLKRHRQQLHRRVADVLKIQFPETVTLRPELLAHHFTEAGQPLEAVPLWLQAGQLASHNNATSEAIAHLRKGIGLLSFIEEETQRNSFELDFRLTLGGTYVVSHGFPHPKVKETFNRARDIAHTIDASPKLALILFNLLSYYFNTEDFKSSRELTKHMMKLSNDPVNGFWFEMFACQLADGDMIAGNFELANQGFQRVLQLFDPSIPFPWELSPCGYIEIGAKAWNMICLQILGFMDQAKSLFDNHLSYASDHNDSMTLYHIYTFPALYSLEAREWKTAEEIIEVYFPIVREFGDPIFILTAEVYYYIAKAFQGDKIAFNKALNLINVCFNIGFNGFAVALSAFIGELYFLNGDKSSSLEWIDKMLDHVNKTGSHKPTSELFRIKGLVLSELDNSYEEAEENFHQALTLADKQSAKTFELRAAYSLARLWKKQNKKEEACDLLKGVYNWFTEGFDSTDLKKARELLNELQD